MAQAEYIVYSYDTPIAWYGCEPLITLDSVEEFLTGPGIEELERFLDDPEARPPHYAFPSSEKRWQVPAVKYSRTTTVNHIGAVWGALAYEKTWRESEDGKSVPSPHWAQTEYARTGTLEKRDCSTGSVNW